MMMSDSELITCVDSLVVEETKTTVALLEHLSEVERRKLHLALGYPTLFMYCVKRLKYSEPSASRRVRASRLMREHPELKELLLSRDLSITNLCMAAPHFSPETKDDILCGILGRTKREAEAFLKGLSPEEEKEDEIEIRYVVSKEELVMFERAQMLVSRGAGRFVTEKETAIATLKAFLYRHDPEERIKRRRNRAEKKALKTGTRYIPVKVADQVMVEDNACCTFTAKDGTRCGNTVGLLIDHGKPYALGGTNDRKNLRLLCANHNRYLAERTFGPRTFTGER